MPTAHPLKTFPTLTADAQSPASSLRPITRRPNRTQGRALEVLAHAVEYIADMRLWDELALPGDSEAMHILMRSSRMVFQECEEVSPVWERFVGWALHERKHLAPSR